VKVSVGHEEGCFSVCSPTLREDWSFKLIQLPFMRALLHPLCVTVCIILIKFSGFKLWDASKWVINTNKSQKN